MDHSREWLERYAAKRPALAAALADGEMARAAGRIVRLWHVAWDRRVGELRRGDAITQSWGVSHVHRAATDIMRAFSTKHATFAVFLSEPMSGLLRWQMFAIIVTLVLSQLLVQIWMCVRARLLRSLTDRVLISPFALSRAGSLPKV